VSTVHSSIAISSTTASYREGRRRPGSAKTDLLSMEGLPVIGLSAVLIFEVLAFGGVERWAVLVLQTSTALLLFFRLWKQTSSGQLHLDTNRLYLPIVAFAFLIVAQIAFRLSAYVYATRSEFLKYIAYGILFFLANQSRGRSARKLLYVLAIFGSLVALFALVQHLKGNGKIYWFREAASSSIFGPYVGHDHYAGLMEMLAPIPLAVALLSRTPTKQLLWLFVGSLMASTIFISGSRGGMLAFFIQMLFLAVYFVAMGDGRRRALVLVVACLLIASFLFWIDNGNLAKRVATLRHPLAIPEVTIRLAIARDALKVFKERPVVGWGLGVFPVIYPQYRTFATDVIINQAHNDYVQVLAETGIVGFACLVWFITELYRAGFRNLHLNSPTETAITLAALTACTGILVHSICDFNLHIPANAALFYLLCGIATRQTELPTIDQPCLNPRVRSNRRPSATPSWLQRWQKRVAGLSPGKDEPTPGVGQS
jgi:O-antigen ligase